MRRLQEVQKKEMPTQDEESFLSLFQGMMREASKNIPFNKDYAKLNELFYLGQCKNEIEKANTEEAERQLRRLQELKKYFLDIFSQYRRDLLKSTNSCASLDSLASSDAELETSAPTTAWQTMMCERFSQSKNHIPEDFIEFLKTEGKKYLPENYAPTGGIVESNFPSSTKNKIENFFAHFQACAASDAKEGAGLIASSAPQKSAALGTDADNQALQFFLSMLYAQNVSYIVVLGSNAKRLNYQNIDVDKGNFASMKENDGEVFYVLGNELPEKKITVTQLKVNDNASLNLTNEDCRKLIDIYAKYKAEIILVHCDSGVGRTGQIRLLFALLDYCHNNPSISQDILNLVAGVNAMQRSNALQSIISASGLDDTASAQKEVSRQIKEKIKNTLATLTTLMFEILLELRKIRYCLQTEDQFKGTPVQLLLLLATQNGCKPEELDVIRNCFDLKLPRDLSRSSTLSNFPALQITAATASEGLLMPRGHSSSSSSVSSLQTTPRTRTPRTRPAFFTADQGTQTDDTTTISETKVTNYRCS